MERDLYKVIAENFKMEELDELCFALGLSIDELSGSNLTSKARELQTYMKRRGRTNELLAAVAEARPHLDLRPYGGPGPGGATRGPEPKPVDPQTAVKAQEAPLAGGRAYENFDIRIGALQNGSYPITAESAYGETGKTVWQALPAENEDFQDIIAFLRDLIARPEDAEQLGDTLRSFLFPKEIWDLYGRSLAQVHAQGKEGLRIRLRIGAESPELSQIPWEYCRDDRGFLALNEATPVIRYIPTERPPTPISTPARVRILVVMATPSDQAPLDVEAEKERINEALAKLTETGRVEVQVVPHARRRDLRQSFRRFDPHILHFIGHGMLQDGVGNLVLEDENGKSQLVSAADMLVLLQSSSVKLVVLSACQTAAHGQSEAIMGVAPRLVWAGVPAVIAMQFKVPDKTAVAFSRDLYEFLADGKPLDAAVTEARIGTYFDYDDKVFWAIPVLFMRSPDGVIWQ